jgi:hypothetical protein
MAEAGSVTSTKCSSQPSRHKTPPAAAGVTILTRTAVVLPWFLRAKPGKRRRGSGHRCSESGRFPTDCPERLPGPEDSGSGKSWFEPRRGNSSQRGSLRE